METESKGWSYNDFLALLYIQVASANYCISESEHDIIVQKVGEIQYKKILKKFIKYSDYEVFELLSQLGTIFCSTDEQREMAFDDIRDIIHVDGHKNLLEENMFRTLKKIF